MKILITGGNGYLGKDVVSYALSLGHDVIVSDLNLLGVDERCQKVDVNIFSGAENIYELLGKPDVCIHLAWKDGFVHNSQAHMEDLSKHYIFLRDMVKGGLKSLSVMGTMHEVGYYEGMITTDSPCSPLSLYGIAKNALREAVLQFSNLSQSCSIHWLRAYYIIGNVTKGNSIFSKIYQASLTGKKIFPLNSGKNKYDFIDIKLLAQMIVLSSIQSEIDGIIDVCTGQPKSLREVVEKFIVDHKLDIKLDIGKFPDRKYDSPIVYGDPTKINNILNNFGISQI